MLKIVVPLIALSLMAGLTVGLKQNMALSDYEKCRDRVHYLLSNRHYKQASFWADEAMQKIELTTPVDNICDEFFVESLLSIGKYKQAERLTRILPPLVHPHLKDASDLPEYRQNLRFKALNGLHLYITAAMEASNSEISSNKDFNVGEALLAIGLGERAKQVFKYYPQLADEYNQLLELVTGDNTRAEQLAQKWISIWSDSEGERIYELEFCEDMMLRKKCFKAANILAQEANRIKQL